MHQNVHLAAQPELQNTENGPTVDISDIPASVQLAAQPGYQNTDNKDYRTSSSSSHGALPSPCDDHRLHLESAPEQAEVRRRALCDELKGVMDAKTELERQLQVQENQLQEMLEVAPQVLHPALQAHFDELAAPFRLRLQQYDEVMDQSLMWL